MKNVWLGLVSIQTVNTVLRYMTLKGKVHLINRVRRTAAIMKVDKTILYYPISFILHANNLYAILSYPIISSPIPCHPNIGIKVKENKMQVKNDLIN